jgi:MoaA/NifB/PqqE/SkfB family radical SAM enzyme
MSNNSNQSHLWKGGPGDMYLGDGTVDMSSWFQEFKLFEDQIRDGDIWFCSAPFQLLYTDVKGRFLPCSWAMEAPDDEPPNIREKSIEDYFVHDKTLNKMRKEMTTPNDPLETCKHVCEHCIRQEKEYGRSRRQASLKIQTNDVGIWPMIAEAVQVFRDTGKARMQSRVFEMQIKTFGNTCNLDCFMCMPFDSSTRSQTMQSQSMQGQKVFAARSLLPNDNPKRQVQSKFADNIVRLAPYIRNLKFIGGEPLVMKSFYDVFDGIVESGHSKEIMVKYQTNMASLELDGPNGKKNILDYIPHFDIFEFTISLDGVGKYNDYMRRKSNWETIQSNIKTVLEFPNVRININGVINFLSVIRFYELIEWAEANDDWLSMMNWSEIRNPKLLAANVLPYDLKQELIPKYDNFPDIQQVLREDNGGLSYQDTFDYLLRMDLRYRNSDFKGSLWDLYPELKPYWMGKDLHEKMYDSGVLERGKE